MDKNLHICMNVKVNMNVISYPAWNAEDTAFPPSGFSFLYP
jgi:hypothetical protein